MSVEQRVIEIISEQMGIDKSEITSATSFNRDLNADSLDAVELVMEFEDEFDISIPDEEAESIETVGQAVSYIQKLLGNSWSSPSSPPLPLKRKTTTNTVNAPAPIKKEPKVWTLMERRVLAKVLDFCIILTAMTPLIIIWQVQESKGNALLTNVLPYALLFFIVAYNAIFLERYGATPGKMICGLQVAGRDGKPPSPLRAFLRSFLEVVGAVLLFIGYLWAFFSKNYGRTFHDTVCETEVKIKQDQPKATK